MKSNHGKRPSSMVHGVNWPYVMVIRSACSYDYTNTTCMHMFNY